MDVDITRANAGSILTNFGSQFTRYSCAGPSYDAWVARHFTTQNIRDSLFGASVLDGARGTLLFYGPSQLKQIFVELMMLARRPRSNSPAWHEFFGHARIYPNHCVFNLDQHGCGLNASTWPRFTGNKTWEGGDDFVPHVFELQLRPELRIIGVFNAFRFQASPHGLAQLEYLIKTNGVNAVIFHPPHPNRYYQTQCCTTDAPVCDGCGQHSGVQRSQLERLFAHQKLPALLTGSWGVDEERLADAEGGTAVFASPPNVSSCICPCCTRTVFVGQPFNVWFSMPPDQNRSIQTGYVPRGCPEPERLLSIIPKPLTDHVCQPGPVHGLAMRTAAWARTQLRA